MPGPRILIVEDDAIIARHIQSTLKKNGYTVDSVAASAAQAYQKTSQSTYDLILMDISLDGSQDGIQAASDIQSRIHVPIIYLTAFADAQTLQRAKVTDPFGYIIKPFEEQTLVTNIEMALNKHNLEKRLRESEERFRTLVENQSEGMVIVDPEEIILFANPAFNAILGLDPGQSNGHPILDYIDPANWPLIYAETQKRSQGISSKYEIELTRPDGETRSVHLAVTPWIKEGRFAGSFGLVQDVTERKRIEQAEHDQRALAEALRDTATALNSTLNQDEVLDGILKNIGRVVPHDGANIMLKSEEGLEIVRRHGQFNSKYALSIQAGSEVELTIMRIMAGGQPVIIPDLHNNVTKDQHPGMAWVRSYAGAPIRIKGETIGLLNIGSKTPSFFTPNHLERLHALANQAALAIENARLFEDSQRRTRFLILLNQITQAALQSNSLEQSLHEIAVLLRQSYRSDGVYITFWEEERKLTIPAAASGHTEDEYTLINYDPGDRTLTRTALELGRSLVADNVVTSPYVDHELAKTFPLKSILCIPLIANRQRLGAMLVGFRSQHHFTKSEVAQGEEIASQVSLAISRLRLYEQIQRLAITDELTGLLNRRGIFEQGREQVEQAAKASKPLSMIWLDIDRFKEINDNYGHPVGDEIICAIAERCRNSVKGRDLVGRYGGEGGDELIIILVDTGLGQAESIAERLRQRILDDPITTQGGVISVSVSLGVTALRQGEALAQLLNRADQAMYAAKSAGRNQVITKK